MQTIELDGQKLRKWVIGPSTFLACPERGARLMNWNIRMADSTVRDIIHWPEQTDWSQFAKIRGGNPILFPFCARTYDKGEIGFWKAPDGKKRPMPNHGFTRQGTFHLVNANAKGFSAEFLPDETAQDGYPFAYQFMVNYRFESLALHVDLVLANRDTQPIPWSAGHHFYFTLPWHEDTQRKDYRIIIPAKKAFRAQADGTLSEVKDLTQESTFAEEGLSDRIHCKLKDNTVRFGPKGGEEDIQLHLGGIGAGIPKPWNSVVTWTPDAQYPAYCVEPWMGPPNSPELKNGLHWVEPGTTETFSVTVCL